MTNNEKKDLFFKIFKSNGKKEIMELLKDLDQNKIKWEYFGGRDNNYGSIYGQADIPENAFGEKITNSIDAIIEDRIEKARKNLRKTEGINVQESEKRINPKSVNEAIDEYCSDIKFERTNGKGEIKIKTGIDISQDFNKNITNQIYIVVSEDGNFTVIDRGIGQNKFRFKKTLLSLNENNKMSKFYQHGSYCMGGSATLQFCEIQLIISKRNPYLDECDDNWTYTLICSHTEENLKTPVFKYLTYDGELLSFKSDELDVVPSPLSTDNLSDSLTGGKPLLYGTVIKCFKYSITTGINSVVTKDLKYAYDSLLTKIPFVVRIAERRKNYHKKNANSIIVGSERSLKNDNPDMDKKSTISVAIDGKTIQIPINIIVSRKNINSTVKPGIFFNVNYQTQHSIERKEFKEYGELGLIKDRLTVFVDFTNIPVEHKFDLFNSSRNGIKEKANVIIKEIYDSLIEDDDIKELINELVKNETNKPASNSSLLQIMKTFFTFKNSKKDDYGKGKPSLTGSHLKTPQESMDYNFLAFVKHYEKNYGMQNKAKTAYIDESFKMNFFPDDNLQPKDKIVSLVSVIVNENPINIAHTQESPNKLGSKYKLRFKIGQKEDFCFYVGNTYEINIKFKGKVIKDDYTLKFFIKVKHRDQNSLNSTNTSNASSIIKPKIPKKPKHSLYAYDVPEKNIKVIPLLKNEWDEDKIGEKYNDKIVAKPIVYGKNINIYVNLDNVEYVHYIRKKKDISILHNLKNHYCAMMEVYTKKADINYMNECANENKNFKASELENRISTVLDSAACGIIPLIELKMKTK